MHDESLVQSQFENNFRKSHMWIALYKEKLHTRLSDKENPWPSLDMLKSMMFPAFAAAESS